MLHAEQDLTMAHGPSAVALANRNQLEDINVKLSGLQESQVLHQQQFDLQLLDLHGRLHDWEIRLGKAERRCESVVSSLCKAVLTHLMQVQEPGATDGEQVVSKLSPKLQEFHTDLQDLIGHLQSVRRDPELQDRGVIDLPYIGNAREEPLEALETKAMLQLLTQTAHNLNGQVGEFTKAAQHFSAPSDHMARQPSPPASPSSKASSPLGKARDPKMRHCPEVGFQESVWDTAVFLGVKPMGIAGSWFMFALLCLNVCMQLSYTFIIYQQFTEPTFTPERVEQFKKFRYRVAHDARFLDAFDKSSLASRVCHEDASTESAGLHLDALGSINLYTPTPEAAQESSDRSWIKLKILWQNQGQIMCLVSLLVWCTVVSEEFQTLNDLRRLMRELYRQGVVRIEHSKTRFSVEDGVYVLETLSRFRTVIVILMALLRFSIAVFLMISGMVYLIHTIDLRDLVLNAMALQCVLQIDELLFMVLAPWPVRCFMKSLQQLSLPPNRSWQGVDFFSSCSSVFIIVCISFAIPHWLQPEVNRLRAAREALCAGNQNFVFSRTMFPPYIQWADSKSASTADPFEARIVEDIVFGRSPEVIQDTRLPSIIGSSWSLTSVASWPVDRASHMFSPKCEDFQNRAVRTPASRRIYADALSAALGTTVITCDHEAVRAICMTDSLSGMTARMLCPKTCQCEVPFGEQILNGPGLGCPLSCTRSKTFNSLMLPYSCNETPPEVLAKNQGWVSLANGGVEIARASRWPDNLVRILEDHAQNMRREGCEAISKFRADTGIDFCSESPDATFHSVRPVCPITCGCANIQLPHRVRCPVACFPEWNSSGRSA